MTDGNESYVMYSELLQRKCIVFTEGSACMEGEETLELSTLTTFKRHLHMYTNRKGLALIGQAHGIRLVKQLGWHRRVGPKVLLLFCTAL